ncbi:MAG: TonB-dependent receptor [Bacteroidales bacterium]|nr:TonB-dependent receptor [Bacteroidales bacterium]
MKRNYFTAIYFLIFCTTGLQSTMAQENKTKQDTLRQITIDEVVITANRYNSRVAGTGSSVAVLKTKELQSIPAQNFSSVLNYIPGIFSASNDGMGLNPQLSIRGFFGGGEAEYLTVLVDGIPINDLENGLANWDHIPLNQIEKVELLKGGSSTLYGDAAMGGVLNIRTHKETKNFTSASIAYGLHNTYNIGAAHGGKVGGGNYNLYLNNNATDGFRAHSKWNSINFGARVKLPVSKNSTIAFNTSNQILKSEDPGFMSDSLIADNRDQSQAYFQEDGKNNQKYLAGIEFNSKVNRDADVGVSLNYLHKNTEQYRTYGQYPSILVAGQEGQLYPIGIYDTTIYGNTKKRELTTDQVNLAIRIISRIPELNATITGGIEADYGGYNSAYYDVFKGFANDYSTKYHPVDSLDTKGSGYRVKSAAYLNGEIYLAEPLTLHAGVRYDFISDKFNSEVPDTTISKNNSQISPKISLSLSTGETDNYAGSIFAGYSHAFKAPTIDQRTDYKRLNYFVFFDAGPALIPMEIQAEPFSNPDLKPQTSMNYELGTYQYYKFSASVSGEINLTGYLIKVKDEIDFDLQTQQYKNIIDTEHTGLEISLRLNVKNNWNGFFNYSYSEVKFAGGENEGKTLKGIPENVYAAGISYAPESGFGATLLMNGAGGIYLDDENTQKLDAHTTINTRLDYKFKSARIFLDVNNIFNKHYNSTGYLFDGEKYLYPAMGRFLRAGVNFRI